MLLKFKNVIVILLVLFLAINALYADMSKFLNDFDKNVGDSMKENFIWREMIFFPAAKNLTSKNQRISDISVSVYNKLFMKIPHFFPFLEKAEIESEFMKFADKLSEDIVVVVFQSLNQPNGLMQKDNKYAILYAFKASNADAIGWFYVPTQWTPTISKSCKENDTNSLIEAINRMKSFNQILSPSLNQISDYLNFTNRLGWSLFRTESELFLSVDSRDAKNGFVLKTNIKTGKLLEFYPTVRGE